MQKLFSEELKVQMDKIVIEHNWMKILQSVFGEGNAKYELKQDHPFRMVKDLLLIGEKK